VDGGQWSVTSLSNACYTGRAREDRSHDGHSSTQTPGSEEKACDNARQDTVIRTHRLLLMGFE
jgi:hypothetical protein